MPARLKLRHGVLAVGMLTLAFYQNCAQTPDDGSLNSSSSYEESLPFAYDAKIDTLAYMSCSEMQDGSYDPRAYFSFRAGAYNSSTGGLGMTADFRSKTQYYTNTARGNLLAESSNNSNSLLTLSIRSRSDFQSLWATDQITRGGEIDQFLPELDSPLIAGPFASLGTLANGASQYINYFPGPDDQRLMEASLRFLKYENVANDTRNNLSAGTSLLVVGFSKSGDILDPSLRTPLDFPPSNAPAPAPTPGTNTKTQAFGTGYVVPFALPAGYLSGDRRVLGPSGLQEIDLTTNRSKVGAIWDCSQNYEFMVIRPVDIRLGRVACYAQVDRPNSAAQVAALNAIRRVLPVEDWFVDLNNHCIIPKGTEDMCYGSTIGTRTVQYGISQCVDTATTTCPHFVSVCIRQ